MVHLSVVFYRSELACQRAVMSILRFKYKARARCGRKFASARFNSERYSAQLWCDLRYFTLDLGLADAGSRL